MRRTATAVIDDELKATGERPIVSASRAERAKALGMDEGHSHLVAIARSFARDDATPEQAPAPVRRAYNERLRVVLLHMMATAGVSCGDVGAAVALSAQMVQKSRSPGGRSVLAADLLAMAERGPARLREALAPLAAALHALEDEAKRGAAESGGGR